ncbi:MAG: TonB-dependent receptor, partial [Gammaproteobacteria bacterium]|nr:TonB-dependent receptor [Gammaproteobacteria bacterium]
KERVSQDEDGRTISPAIFRDATSPSSLVNGKPPANSIITSVFTPMPSTVSRDTESLSAYAQLEFDLSETIKLTVEGRYIDEELEVSGPVCDIVATPALSGRPNQPPDANGDVFCDGSFRGSSSVAEVLAGGSLPEGSLTKAAILTDTAKFDDSFIAPKAILEWAASDSQLFYASIGKGIKPGGISTITAGSFFRPNQNTFDKEELWSYELGSKSTLLDGDLVVNSSLFYQDYSDKQVGVSRFDPVIQTDVGSIENAGEAEIYGFEIEAIWRVTDALTMSGGYTFVDAEYTDFVIETSSANNVARSLAAGDGGCLTIIDNDPAPLDGQSDICIVDLTDNEVEDVPKHSFVGNLRYQAAAGDTGLEWFGGLTTIYRAERFMDEFNIKELDSYWLTDARAGLIGDNWELTFFVDNVFDDDTVKSGVDFGSQVNTVKQGYFPPGPTDGVVVSLPDPRVVGARLNFTF